MNLYDETDVLGNEPAPHPIAAQSAPDEREAWWQLIHDTLRYYRMSTLDDGHGGGYPLIDAMTADGQPVSGGIEECTYLADAIWNALCSAWQRAQSAPVVPEGKLLVSDEPLRRVLNALINAPHQIRELQATREPVALFADNPINVLIAEYNAAHGEEE